MKHSVGPELNQVPIEDLRRLNCGRAMHPRAERAQDASEDCSAAEALEYRLELCMNDSAAPPSELREHWPAVRCICRAKAPYEKPLQANVYESDDERDEKSAVYKRKRERKVAKAIMRRLRVEQRC